MFADLPQSGTGKVSLASSNRMAGRRESSRAMGLSKHPACPNHDFPAHYTAHIFTNAVCLPAATVRRPVPLDRGDGVVKQGGIAANGGAVSVRGWVASCR